MGYGRMYVCKTCVQRYFAGGGIGYLYPQVYRDLVKDIKDGKYGKEQAKVFKETPCAAVSAENFVYICRNCNNWKVDKDPTVYKPKDNDEALRSAKADMKAGYVLMLDEYTACRRYYHRCDKCGGRMHKATDSELERLACSKCEEINEAKAGIVMWD
ncbi:MAG: hypothetical protein IKN47_04780 [Lachnospiraceae bacterium]|nr:hypothetical protein [Lachnospiraceae bacterium]